MFRISPETAEGKRKGLWNNWATTEKNKKKTEVMLKRGDCVEKRLGLGINKGCWRIRKGVCFGRIQYF